MNARPVSITVAPNGARRGKAEHGAIPLVPAEIAAEALSCQRAGAAILHLHVRADDAGHSLDTGRYAEATAAVREACDMVIQPTTERVGRFAPEDMMAVQRALQPEMITFNLNELLDPQTEVQHGIVRDFLAETAAAGTVPQYIVYSLDQLRELVRWWEAGWVPQREPFILIVLGRYAGTTSHPTDILAYLPHIPERWRWGVCAFGAPELACVTQAALAGGHCRVGFENNLTDAHGAPLKDNADQVGRLAGVLDTLGLARMSAAEVRTQFGLKTPA